jgi:UDPglucose--hexose-1-phosphate uridylyltransferase
MVSPNRTQRPWQGQVEETPTAAVAHYDPQCYLCPGNERANGMSNPDYLGPYAFDNDFPALSAVAEEVQATHPLFRSQPESGICRVVCYSQRHDIHLTDMSIPEIVTALEFLAAEFKDLDEREDIAYVQVFENRGQMMGCSNPHPHAQIWATSELPVEPAKELKSQWNYFEAQGRSLLIDYLEAELDDGSRLVNSNEHAVSLVPFWAVWPFETLLLPRRPMASLNDMNAKELEGFARVLKNSLLAYDGLFNSPMPYSMGFHPRPGDGADHPEWQFHAHIYPPLLRSATVRKHMVGFEMLGMPQRDLTPEAAAERLREALNRVGKHD